MAHEDMDTHVAADEVHEEDNDLKEAPKATSGNKTYNAAELSKKVRKLESLFTEFKTTILYLQNQNNELAIEIERLKKPMAPVAMGEAQPGNVWLTESLNPKQRAEIWQAIEPKVEEKVKGLVEDASIKQIATTVVDKHVELQTQEITRLTQEYAVKTERGNANAEKVLQLHTANNVRMVNVGADFRDNNKTRLIQKAQATIRQVSQLATVIDAKYYLPKIRKGDKEEPQTHLVVTLQGPAAVADVIAGARKKRKEYFQAKATSSKANNVAEGDANDGNGSFQEAKTKKSRKKKGPLSLFPYCDRDLTPEMLKLRQRMELKLREWRDQARPDGKPGKQTGYVDIGAWIDYRTGRPVLLKRNKADVQGDPRGAVREWIWQPSDVTKPEEGEFVVAPKNATKGNDRPQASKP